MKRILVLSCTLLFNTLLLAQYLEIGTLIGTSNYMGELSQQSFSAKEFNTSLGIFGRYNFSEYLSVKASFTQGSISGSDQNASNEATRMRNLSFRSNILELAITGEFNLAKFNIRAQKTAAPYLFLGLAAFHFNPEAQLRGEWHNLHSLTTEPNKYSRVQLAIPFGFGFKFNLSYKINFGLELGARRTFTDYLDDVSGIFPDIVAMRKHDPLSAALSYRTPEVTGQFGENPVGLKRGDPSNRDWYFFGGVTISVNLTDKYGLDFDPQFDAFKEHLKKPEKKKKLKKVKKRQKTKRYQQKQRKKRRGKALKMPVKKRTH